VCAPLSRIRLMPPNPWGVDSAKIVRLSSA